MNITEILPGIHYVGVNDRTTTRFEGLWSLPHGVSYNAYLVADEKVALIDTVEESFGSRLEANISEAIGERKIDYLVVNHMEPDHSSSIAALRRIYPDIEIVGNAKMLAVAGIEAPNCEIVGTILHVLVDDTYAGHIVIADTIKTDAEQTIRDLHAAGVKRTVMLTGDREEVAASVAKQLGLDEFHAQLLPGDKVERVEALLAAESGKGKLAFVGDGINDAPVLTRADVGIAMGAMGSDAAIEAADVVLMDDKPSNISRAIRVARKTMTIVWQNIIFALGVKLLILVLAALGIANMWLAVFGDVGVAIIAILNAMRAMGVKNL